MIPRMLSESDFCIGSMFEASDGKQRRCIIGHCMESGVPTTFRKMLTYTCAMCLTDPAQWRRLSPERAAAKSYGARDEIAQDLGIFTKNLPAFSAEDWPNLCWVKVRCNDEQGPKTAAKAWNLAVDMFEQHQKVGVP